MAFGGGLYSESPLPWLAEEDAMPDGVIYFICGVLTCIPFATWFGIQIGKERSNEQEAQ